jgi:tetratricopeptide (TPR) repeat protein
MAPVNASTDEQGIRPGARGGPTMAIRLRRRPGAALGILGCGLLTALLALAIPPRLGAQGAQDRENRALAYLMQADDLYAKGNYDKAAESYGQVSLISTNRLNLSRAYMGLALCYFYQNDTANAKVYILKVLEIDPQKEVSNLFHPQTFVDLFEEVRKENADRIGRGLPPLALEEPQAARPNARPAPRSSVTAVSEEKPAGPRGGHWEIGFHYSSWGVNLAKGLFEDALIKAASEKIRDNVTSQLDALYPGHLNASSDTNGLGFDSQGSNYGAELRFYPLGRRGSMSIGFSIEQTHVKLMMKGPVTQNYSDGSSATVEGDAVVETNPVTTHLSFRWDFVPSSRVTPYFIFGLGLGPLNGEARYTYTGTYTRGSQQAGVTGDWLKTFDELRQEGEIDLNVLVMIHAAFGLSAEVVRGVILKGEAGFWDGLILRAGLAFRL